jgi:hypothetical protein
LLKIAAKIRTFTHKCKWNRKKKAPKVIKTRGAFFALNNAKDKNAPKVIKTHGAFFILFEQCQRFIKSLCDAPN